MGRFAEYKAMLSVEGSEVEFNGNGVVWIRQDVNNKIILGESEVKELVLQIIKNRIVSGQNNHGGI